MIDISDTSSEGSAFEEGSYAMSGAPSSDIVMDEYFDIGSPQMAGEIVYDPSDSSSDDFSPEVKAILEQYDKELRAQQEQEEEEESVREKDPVEELVRGEESVIEKDPVREKDVLKESGRDEDVVQHKESVKEKESDEEKEKQSGKRKAHSPVTVVEKESQPKESKLSKADQPSPSPRISGLDITSAQHTQPPELSGVIQQEDIQVQGQSTAQQTPQHTEAEQTSQQTEAEQTSQQTEAEKTPQQTDLTHTASSSSQIQEATPDSFCTK